MEDERSHEAEVDGFLVLSRIAFQRQSGWEGRRESTQGCEGEELEGVWKLPLECF